LIDSNKYGVIAFPLIFNRFAFSKASLIAFSIYCESIEYFSGIGTAISNPFFNPVLK
jgi:hypothetical protein